jgi:hypothetical protein
LRRRQRARRAQTPRVSGESYRLAAITAAVGLLGAVIGGGFTYLGTSQQIHAQRDQEQESFIRDQRRASYGQVVQADQRLQEAEQRLRSGPTLDPTSPAGGQQYTNLVAAVDAARNALTRANSEVLLVGSGSAISASQKLAEAHQVFSWDLAAVVGAEVTNERSPYVRELRRGLDDLRSDVAEASIDFAFVVRDELGVPY